MLIWTKEKPTQPGWYWMEEDPEKGALALTVQIVADTIDHPGLLVIAPSTDPAVPGYADDLDFMKYEWAGPLEPPT